MRCLEKCRCKSHGRKTIATFAIDYAFNNAGIEGDSAPTADCTEENWDKTIAINLKGIGSACNMKLLKCLQGKGTIVNCSSVAGLVGFRTACIRCPSMA
jgi:NAD(P)-dependent dehydrogenase (short-subunit alcohol dehydrogenase family)